MKEELIAFLIAMLPVLELRGSIPLSMLVFEFSALKAFSLAVAGGIISIIPVIFFLEKFSGYLMRKWYWYNRFMSWLFDRARRKHLDHFHNWNWSGVALFIFVAIPLPFTGAWSGAIVALILGIPFWRAVGAISLGILAAGGLVTLFTSLGFVAVKSFL